MGFLLQMGFQDLRQPYSCTGLAPVQLRVVADLVQLGVLYLHRVPHPQPGPPTQPQVKLSHVLFWLYAFGDRAAVRTILAQAV